MSSCLKQPKVKSGVKSVGGGRGCSVKKREAILATSPSWSTEQQHHVAASPVGPPPRHRVALPGPRKEALAELWGRPVEGSESQVFPAPAHCLCGLLLRSWVGRAGRQGHGEGFGQLTKVVENASLLILDVLMGHRLA